jgi:sigma-B regulation protein RsbU (phosphoserine phosphatase)
MAPMVERGLVFDDAQFGAAPFRVLVADDDPGLRGLLTSYLAAEGVEVETVASGREAIDRLREAPPDILFLDVAMPGKSGLDVLAVIREHQVDAAVIITTAYGSEEVAVESLRRGADDYLRKPFDQGDVRVVLDRTMARLLLSRQNVTLRQHLAEQKRQLDQELARAAQVVAELLPPAPPAINGYGLAAACLSAREVGGDFYDWHQLPSGSVSLTVGDVMGKGLSAALLMATVRAVLRAVVTESAPGQVVSRAAAALDSDLSRSGAFVTLFHAQMDSATGRLRYVDAGHGYVLLRRQDGSVEDLKPWGLPLGVNAEEKYFEGTVDLAPGDTLLIYSDGLVEARPDVFATREGVARFVGDASDAAGIVRGLVNEVTQIRPLPDDLTVVALRRQPDAA